MLRSCSDRVPTSQSEWQCLAPTGASFTRSRQSNSQQKRCYLYSRWILTTEDIDMLVDSVFYQWRQKHLDQGDIRARLYGGGGDELPSMIDRGYAVQAAENIHQISCRVTPYLDATDAYTVRRCGGLLCGKSYTRVGIESARLPWHEISCLWGITWELGEDCTSDAGCGRAPDLHRIVAALSQLST